MTVPIDNTGETDYPAKVAQVAAALAAWEGPIVLVGHVDPDGDALGSTLALKRALERLGKDTLLPLAPPRYLAFLAEEGELSAPLVALPKRCLLAILDTEPKRVTGAPLEGAAFTLNIDHHGTNPRTSDLALVEPAKAATAQIVKDIIDALGVAWTVAVATPCLTGLLTDTGTFRFGNTSPEVLRDAGELVAHGVAYAELTDRLQWRHPDYFRLLGMVMATVAFPLGGLLATARLTRAMRDEIGASDDDSDDFVGQIRYAEGVQLAVLFKERDDQVKISVRSRGTVSAQALCVQLGGGGHVAAAGASLFMSLEQAEQRVLEVTRDLLQAEGFALSD